jgi:CPA1 family monovalent cation:H+ antiporter
VWNTLDFVLNGLVFILIGLQLPHILEGIRDLSPPSLLFDGALLSVVLIALRMCWVFAESWISHGVRRLIRRPEPRVPAKELFIVGWTGMRGVIALAAAISLPEMLDDGKAFPQRDVLIFLTFCVILVTLVVQGLSLPLLIRKLGLAAGSASNMEEREARLQMVSAAIDQIGALRERGDPADDDALTDLLFHYQQRLEAVNETFEGDTPGAADYGRYYKLSSQLRGVERLTALGLLDRSEINDEVFRRLERELDLQDSRHRSSHP